MASSSLNEQGIVLTSRFVRGLPLQGKTAGILDELVSVFYDTHPRRFDYQRCQS
ncbi:hypothetical protein CI610_01311 [invertebrate metagenome]|uniref:Uncharacterized protein n=1 Tax=invertebrate metagenome TaxID=1711999 RepID=A0A2H9T932_9ZZZZ